MKKEYIDWGHGRYRADTIERERVIRRGTERERHRQRDDGSLVMKRRTTALHPDTPRLVQR